MMPSNGAYSGSPCPVGMLGDDVAYLQCLETATRLIQQHLDPFDGIDASHQRREHRGLVPRTRPTSMTLSSGPASSSAPSCARRIGLGDRLTVTDRQRRILVGATRQRLVDEQVARGKLRMQSSNVPDGRVCLHRANAGPDARGYAAKSCR